MIGETLGHYEVVAKLGEGGMSEVYRARDTKLRRDVALKVLPDAVATDPQRLARFQREAQVLASLNHPNIAHIYGVEDSNFTRPFFASTSRPDIPKRGERSRPQTSRASSIPLTASH